MKKSEMKRMLAEVFKTYDKAQGVKSVAVKNDDYNPRANEGLYVLTIWAEFVSPSKGKDTETISVKRGYKNLNSAIGAAKHAKMILGRDFYKTGRKFTGALILKDFSPYWQVLYRQGQEITRVNDLCACKDF